MSESLYAHKQVTLFGKLVEDLQIGTLDDIKSAASASDSGFARIYGYSYGGAYYELASPVLFQVEGGGTAANKEPVPGPALDDDDPFYESLMVWSYDHSKKTTRLDVASGTFDQVLLSDVTEGGPGVSGARVSGARVSGARVSGARVSGARISGARLSGARGDASD